MNFMKARGLRVAVILVVLLTTVVQADEKKKDLKVTFVYSFELRDGIYYMAEEGWEYYFLPLTQKILIRSPDGEIVRDPTRTKKFIEKVRAETRHYRNEIRDQLDNDLKGVERKMADRDYDAMAIAVLATASLGSLLYALRKADLKHKLFGRHHYDDLSLYASRLMKDRILATQKAIGTLESELKEISELADRKSARVESIPEKVAQLKKLNEEAKALNDRWSRFRSLSNPPLTQLEELENRGNRLQADFKKTFDELHEIYDGTRPFANGETAYAAETDKPLSSRTQPGEITAHKEISLFRGKVWQRYSVMPGEFISQTNELVNGCIFNLSQLLERKEKQLQKLASAQQKLKSQLAFDALASGINNFGTVAALQLAGTVLASQLAMQKGDDKKVKSGQAYWSDVIVTPEGETKKIELPEIKR